MELAKQLISSKTIWGAIVALFSVVNMLLGVDISQELILEIQSSLKGILSAVGVLVGNVMIIIGRIKARGPMSNVKPTE